MEAERHGWVWTLRLERPSLRDNTADADRLLLKLKKLLRVESIGVDLALLRELPAILRRWDYHVRCVVFKDGGQWRLVGVLGGNEETVPLGLAVDLGTTRVVVRLVELEKGEAVEETSFDNPQIAIGPDVLARIHFAGQSAENRRQLRELIIDGLNRGIQRLCPAGRASSDNIFLVAVAGNTVMTHLFLELDTHWLIREPYIPVVNAPADITASQLGLWTNPRARMLIFPNVGSYFGGDLISGILFAGLHENDETAILVDVGTNAEVVLGNRHWLMACAGAAGPALEGGVTRMGMMAGPGVIDQVTIDRRTRELHVHTIGEQPPRGICGSGLIDLAAQLFLSGIIDIRGKFQPEQAPGRIVEKDGLRHLIVVPAGSSATGEPLTISQADLDSLVRSKAAMYTILETITTAVGVTFRELARFYVAGTFGAYIRPSSAIAIGMLPDLPPETYQTLGNSSLAGAAMVLARPDRVDEISRIRDRITYLELNVNQDLMNRFSAAKFFPHTDAQRFPTVRVWE
ncbi:MAG: ASKHA domain-containing protein [Thermodesulfobacteriota bacterium]